MRTIQLAFSLSIIFFLFTACTTSDSCENTICLNDGICINGLCDCPDRYTGPNCQEQVTPHKIRLIAVSVTRFPAYNTRNDMQWDGTDGPDLFFRLYDEEGPLAQPLILIENADPGKGYTFSINAMDIFHLTQVYTLRLLDYEGVGIDSENMGEIHFQLYHDTNGFPEQIVVDDGGPVAFTLKVEYVHSSPKSGS